MSEDKTNFEATGESVTIELSPANPDTHKAVTVTVERGTFTDKNGDAKAKPWFRGSVAGVAGKPGANAKSALTGVLSAIGVGKFDNFIVEDDSVLTTGIFDTSGTNAPKEEDVWERDDAEALEALRVRAQAEFDAAQDSESAMQRAWYNTAVMMQFVLDDTFGGNTKAYANWAKGPEGSETAPELAKLGKQGVNALSEARVFATFDDDMLALVPVGIARGKAVAKYRNEAINYAFDSLVSAFDARVKSFKWDSDKSVEQAAKAISAETGDDAMALVRSHAATFDKFDPAMDADHRRAAQTVLGGVFMSDLWEEFNELNAELDAIGEGIKESVKEKARKRVENCAFVKRLTAAFDRAAAEKERNANENAVKAQKKSLDAEVDKGENINEGVGSDFKSTAASIVAAQVFNTVAAHPAALEIFDQIAILAADLAERRAAEEKEEKAAA